MAKRKFYYKLEEAEKLKQTFSSWINRSAHIGNGQICVLRKIVIKPKRNYVSSNSSSQFYSVEFQFNDAKNIDASHFLLSNGLMNMVEKLLGAETKSSTQSYS